MTTFSPYILYKQIKEKHSWITKLFFLRSLFFKAYSLGICVLFSKNGYSIRIGNKIKMRILPQFFYFEHFGDRHNKGWGDCIELLRSKTCFLDVGAHIGLYSVPASKVMPSNGRIFSFEPSTQNHRALMRHLEMNQIKNIETFKTLVGGFTASSIPFYEDASDVSAMNSRVLTKKMENSKAFSQQTRPQITLDTFVAERKLMPQVIKIDVEGAEIDVLRGAVDTLRKHKPIVFLSVHPTRIEAMGQKGEELFSILKDCGYKLTEIDGSNPGSLRQDEYRASPVS